MQPQLSNMSLKEVTIAIEQSPLAVERWERMWELIRSQNDQLSSKSIEVIVSGMRSLDGETSEGGGSFSALGSVLMRLARSYNNPKLFKEAGKSYLQDLHMPRVARDHLDRALALGCRDSDLKPLQEAVLAILRRQGSKNELGVEKVVHRPKVVSEMIRRSGRLCIMKHPTVQSAPASPTVPIQAEQLNAPLDPQDCLDQAWEAVSQGNWPTAKRMLGSLNVASVGAEALWEAWTEMGEGCYTAGRSDDTEVAYRAAAAIMPDLLVSQFNLGVGLQMNHKYTEALEAYMRADSIQPSHPKVWCNLGSVFFLMEDYSRSEAALRTTVLLRPDYARAWDNLGAALGAQNKLDEAVEACNRALALQPAYPESSFKLGVIYFSQRRFGEALPHLASASSLPSLSFYTNAYLSMTLAGLGNMVGAEHALKMATSAPGAISEILSMVWSAIGRSRLERLEFNKSRQALEEACRLNPRDSQNWLDLGLAHQFGQDNNKASECFQRALELDELAVSA